MHLLNHPPYSQPDHLKLGSYRNQENYSIRYAWLPAEKEEIAQAVIMGAQTHFIEAYYEAMRDLSARGIGTYFVERMGDGGSERQFNYDPQKPSVKSISYYAEDLHQFVTTVVKRSENKPLGFLSLCVGGLVGLRTFKDYPTDFDFGVMVSPMFGSALKLANTDEKEQQCIAGFAQKNPTDYIAKDGHWSKGKLIEQIRAKELSNNVKRAGISLLWQSKNEKLRMGGFTFGTALAAMKEVQEFMKPGVLESIQTPVTILTSDDDKVNRTDRHHLFADRLPNGNCIDVIGAKHNLWVENNEFRESIFAATERQISLYHLNHS